MLILATPEFILIVPRGLKAVAPDLKPDFEAVARVGLAKTRASIRTNITTRETVTRSAIGVSSRMREEKDNQESELIDEKEEALC